MLHALERVFYHSAFGTKNPTEIVRLVALKAYNNERFTPGVTVETGTDFVEKDSFVRVWDRGENVVSDLQALTDLRHTLFVQHDAESVHPIERNEYMRFVAETPKDYQKAALVPKNNKEERLIFPQPLLHIWRQIAIGEVLRDILANWVVDEKSFRNESFSPVPKGQRINLSQNLLSQEDNGLLAIKLSKGGFKGFSLDLRGASDSISREWVKVNLPITFAILSGDNGEGCITGFNTIVEKSSFEDIKKKLPDLGLPNIEIFPFIAGMGNGWTFPLETMIFTFLGLAAAIPTIGLSQIGHSRKTKTKVFGVYGDDIIFANNTGMLGKNLDEFFKIFNKYLTESGFEINTEKSSVNLQGEENRVFESCGVFAYKSVDVRPIYLKSDKAPCVSNGGLSTCYPFLNGIAVSMPYIFKDFKTRFVYNQLGINSAFGMAFFKERLFEEDKIFKMEIDENELCLLALADDGLTLGTIQSTMNYEKKLLGKGLFVDIFSSDAAALGDPYGMRAINQGRFDIRATRKKAHQLLIASRGAIGTTNGKSIHTTVKYCVDTHSSVPYGLNISERDLMLILRCEQVDGNSNMGMLNKKFICLEKKLFVNDDLN